METRAGNIRVDPGKERRKGMGRKCGLGLVVFFIAAGLIGTPLLAAPKRGGVYRSSMPTDLTNMDLHRTQAQIDNAVLGMIVYEPLFTYDEKFNVKPFLCESYKMSPDGLNLTLNIKKGVKFHNRTELKAEDVKFCLDRVRDPNLPGAAQRVSLQNVKEVKVTGPYQVQMILSKPIPNIFYILATSVGTVAMMPKKVLESHGNKVLRPIGTGPYEFVAWERDSKVMLKRFEAYSSADGPVNGYLGKRNRYFDQIIFYVMKEPATRIMALDRGDLDAVPVLPYQQIDDLKKRSDLQVRTGLAPDAPWYLFYVNFNHPYLSKLDFRKAMAYALDRKEITKAAVWGYGTPTFSVIPPMLPAYSPELEKMAPQYDPAKAKEFLQKIGYKGEKIKILTSKNYTPMYDQVLAAQAMWAAVGINTEVEVVDWATHLARWQKGEHEILSFAMIGRMDPLSQTVNLGPRNFYNYKNQEAFALREALQNTWDPQKQNELFRKIYELTCRDVPYMINFYIHNSIALKPYVKGYDPNFDPFAGRVWNYYFEK
ncbi:MAG: ABC transporter substrate-binding protein [Planctomycetaceae bacterium]